MFFVSAQTAQPTVIPAGTRVEARLESAVKTATSNSGDAVVAVLSAPIRAAGKILVPEGSILNGRVETIQAGSRTNEGRVRLAFREIQLADGRKLTTWITDSYFASPPKRKLKYILAMTLGGAAGGLVGGKAARAAGVLGGVLVGFVIAGNTGDDKLPDLALKPGQTLHLQLGEDLRL